MLHATAGIIQSVLMLFNQIPDSSMLQQMLTKEYMMGSDSLPVYGYQVINQYPHDTNAFTQGLIYKDGYMYEGTGLYGESSLRKVIFETGTITKIHNLDGQYFGEGVTIYHDTIRQLTWRNDVGFVYIEGDTFECIDTFSYTTEGWGLTHNDTCLIMSDGTPVIRFRDPVTYQEIGQITVTAEGVEVSNINELEYIQNKIYANIWYSDSIAIIDPTNGHVLSWVNCSEILSSPPNVLNGIAFDPVNVRLFVTGKLWPTLFEIETDPINYPPEIILFYPSTPCSISTDSTLHLGISTTDPDPQDSLIFTWKVNHVLDTTAHDSTYVFSGTQPAVDTITALVSDSMYCDSTTWLVYVSTVGISRQWVVQPFEKISIPNPYTPGACISFFLDSPGRVEVNVYDVLGREVVRSIHDFCDRGMHSMQFQSIRVPGVYFVHISTHGTHYIDKFVFMY